MAASLIFSFASPWLIAVETIDLQNFSAACGFANIDNIVLVNLSSRIGLAIEYNFFGRFYFKFSKKSATFCKVNLVNGDNSITKYDIFCL